MAFEQRALVRFVQILFERRQAVLARRVEEVVQELQRVEIDRGGVAAAFEDLKNAADDRLQNIERISDQNRP